jgi:hypothetical protein
MLWVGGSLVVAFPSDAFSLNLAAMITTFAVAPKHPLSVIVLLFIDLVIVVGCIRDRRVRAGISHWLGVIVVCLLVFIIAAFWGPIMAPNAPTHAALTGSLAVLALVVARGLTYAAPEQATPVRALGVEPPQSDPVVES